MHALLLRITLALALLSGCARTEHQLVRRLAAQQLWLEVEARLQAELERAPDSAALHNDLAVCYEALGKRELALAEYRRALDLAPDDRRIRANLEAAERLAASGSTPGSSP